jgi:hypothetical protein
MIHAGVTASITQNVFIQLVSVHLSNFASKVVFSNSNVKKKRRKTRLEAESALNEKEHVWRC